MIKCIIFDLGGIVIPEKSDIIEKKIAKYIGINSVKLSELKRELKVTTGEIKLLDFYYEVIKATKKNIKSEDVLQRHIKIYKETSTKRNPEILLLIKKLKTKYVVACLTNTEIEIADFNRKNGLFDYFDEVYLSSEMGLRKPQSEIYLKILDDLGIQSREALFIDDNLKYVNGAKKVGINTILFHNIKQMKKEMSDYGINIS